MSCDVSVSRGDHADGNALRRLNKTTIVGCVDLNEHLESIVRDWSLWRGDKTETDHFFFPWFKINGRIGKTNQPTVGGETMRPGQSEVGVTRVSNDELSVGKHIRNHRVNAVFKRWCEGNSKFVFYHQRGDVLSEIGKGPFCADGEAVAITLFGREWNAENKAHVGGFTGTQREKDSSRIFYPIM